MSSPPRSMRMVNPMTSMTSAALIMTLDRPSLTSGRYTCPLNIHPLALGALRSPNQYYILGEHATLLKQLEGTKSSFVLTEQTGIGKSTFLIYLLLYRLERHLPTAIQFRSDRFILFSAEGAKIHHAYSGHLPALHDLWALRDNNATMEPPYEVFVLSTARIVQVTSPAPDRWKQWLRRASTDLPTLLEIGAVACITAKNSA
ncbi:hypothetical protein C8Q74DRAFT_1058371 [Fomes fomentarius]|nr:hypothetical protein C8Q74DRAFT_1058371 [Fomes fomentarius]